MAQNNGADGDSPANTSPLADGVYDVTPIWKIRRQHQYAAVRKQPHDDNRSAYDHHRRHCQQQRPRSDRNCTTPPVTLDITVDTQTFAATVSGGA